MTEQNWKQVWDRRTLDASAPSRLAALMAADGHDTGFGSMTEAAWRAHVERVAERFELAPGESVYEVGCGAGAFLLPFAEKGHSVGGLDLSEALLGYAREVLPAGTLLEHADAGSVPVLPRFDLVLASGVLLYFPDLAYTRGVLARMVGKARRFVAVLDVADLARKDAAMAHRRGHLGQEEYEKRYAGLEHLFVDRGWMEKELRALGCTKVHTEDQSIEGYANGAFRFNAFGWLP